MGGAGTGHILFERVEVHYDGQAKGVLRQATLFGYYESLGTLALLTPSAPLKLELHNFPFEVVLEEQ
jgi:hypothetical protein